MKFTKAKIKSLSRLGSCGAYGLAMLEMPKLDDKVMACTADLKFYSGLERFSEEYPDRFFNVGIAEQNLVGIAGGLAREGFHPFVSTYASFACTRALDQVKMNMSYMKLPIRLIGLTSGLSVGILGASHICIEDIAIMRSMPNITILSPADAVETVKTMYALANYPGPVYVRMPGAMNVPIVYHEDYEFEIGRAVFLKKGTDIAIIATGTMVSAALNVSEILENDGISCAVVNMHTIKPVDTKILDTFKNMSLIVTMEEHNINGGLGGAIAEYVAKAGGFPRIETVGVDDQYSHAAEYNYLINKNGLLPDMIAVRLKKKLKVKV